MLDSLRTPLALIGRFLLALMFVLAGLSKITGFAGTVGYMSAKGIPAAEVLAVLTILLELGGGLALMAGFHARWAALGLALFTLLASVIFHNFWAVPEAQKMVQQLMFMKNLSVVGGLLMVAALGAGPASLDVRREPVPARA
ncbi:MAG: DoxX family protein [Burkholderiaceae bacterium]